MYGLFQQWLLAEYESVETMLFQEFNGDQRREKVNSIQRYLSWRDAKERTESYRGSLVWQEVKGERYLVRSYYDASGKRRQRSEGRRNSETERLKAAWDQARQEAMERLKSLREVMARQAAINRAVKLGRVPMTGARIIRAIDDAGLLGNGIRIVGTNAIYAYEAAAGVMVNPDITATLDIDLLLDARMSLRMVLRDEASEPTLINLLRKVDRSFTRTSQTFRAVNDEGYLVDLIRPQRDPPWLNEREQIGEAEDELSAVPIHGLSWHESAPPFETVAIDEKGGPVRIIASDPRVFAAHKLWLSRNPDREPTKRRRDAAQAQVVAQMVARYLIHLPYDRAELRMLPKELFEQAAGLFDVDKTEDMYTF
ncbi:GSU2403 family nucleotidyltransferase fold protein [Microvirga solisilvae]|uniref:GSU2403 family nucleotidyltransferase fold protein n=1 Tax=Microvirga solisilvae TaxID=2919498 RepID=UPI001FB00CA0